jgi:hypothetical protein
MDTLPWRALFIEADGAAARMASSACEPRGEGVYVAFRMGPDMLRAWCARVHFSRALVALRGVFRNVQRMCAGRAFWCQAAVVAVLAGRGRLACDTSRVAL